MRALVAHASDRGSTEELAGWIAAAMTDAGVPTEVAPCARVDDLADVDAVVVAGALYLGRWHADARRFVKRHAPELRTRAVWLCSTGPLDDTATAGDLDPVSDVTRALQRARARSHRTFGGRLDADTTGPIAGRIAAQAAGDYRDRPTVEAWARDIAAALQADPG